MAAVADSLIPPALLRPVAVRRSSRSGIIPRPGLPDGLELKVAILPVGSDLYNRAGQWICSRFEEAGVKVSHATHTLDEFRSALTTGDVDFVIGRWQAEYPDADSFFHGLFQSRSGALSRFFSSSSMDAAIDSGRRESDPVERDPLRNGICRNSGS